MKLKEYVESRLLFLSVVNVPRPLGLGDPVGFWPEAKRAVAMVVVICLLVAIDHDPLQSYEVCMNSKRMEVNREHAARQQCVNRRLKGLPDKIRGVLEGNGCSYFTLTDISHN